MIGTVNQADWAEQIKTRVSVEFELRGQSARVGGWQQTPQKRMETLSVIALLERRGPK